MNKHEQTSTDFHQTSPNNPFHHLSPKVVTWPGGTMPGIPGGRAGKPGGIPGGAAGSAPQRDRHVEMC